MLYSKKINGALLEVWYRNKRQFYRTLTEELFAYRVYFILN